MEFYKINNKRHCNNYLTLILISIGVAAISCKKIIAVAPPISTIVGSQIYNSKSTAASVLTGIYFDMSTYSVFSGNSGLSIRSGLSGDELISSASTSSLANVLFTNALTNEGDQLFWPQLYSFIFRINAAIEGISASKGITDEGKSQLLGEAKFLRAFMYFHLVNLYGDVPLLLSTDVKINSLAPRIEKSAVYQQIIKDLLEAQNLLNDNYYAGNLETISAERLRPNNSVATALLSRVYLYTQQFALAEQEASKLLTDGAYELETLDGSFLKGSKEAIWQLQPVSPDINNTLDASVLILSIPPIGPNADSRPYYLSKNIFNSFELGDMRKTHWIDSVKVGIFTYPYANKYKLYLDQPRNEYLIVFRLAEQYLIRSEARAHLGKLVGDNSAIVDLNTIRQRAGLDASRAASQQEILEAISRERKVELFTEWGHRWFDLKRTGKIDEVMNIVSVQKGGMWAAYKSLYPIPVTDIQYNPTLRGHQNPGYPEN